MKADEQLKKVTFEFGNGYVEWWVDPSIAPNWFVCVHYPEIDRELDFETAHPPTVERARKLFIDKLRVVQKHRS